MLTFLAIVALCAGAVWVINRKLKNDVPTSVLKLTTKTEETAKKVVKETADILDVNDDKKINVEDVKAVAKKAKGAATKAAAKVRKPKTKKPKA